MKLKRLFSRGMIALQQLERTVVTSTSSAGPRTEPGSSRPFSGGSVDPFPLRGASPQWSGSSSTARICGQRSRGASRLYTWVLLDARNASRGTIEIPHADYEVVYANNSRASKLTLFASSQPITTLCIQSASASDDWVDLASGLGAFNVEYGPNHSRQSSDIRLGPLLRLVGRFRDEGYPCDMDSEVSRITPETAEAASQFLRLVPQNSALPKIAPDGENGLVMAWDLLDGLVLLTIDGWVLHAVAAAATPWARYYDDMSFDGHTIPSKIREELQFA